MKVLSILVIIILVFMLGVWYEHTTHVGKSIAKDLTTVNKAMQYTKKLSREKKIKLLGG